MKSRLVQKRPQGKTPMNKIYSHPIYQLLPFNCPNGRNLLFNKIHGRKNLSHNITIFNLSFSGLYIIHWMLEWPQVMRTVHNSP